MPDEPANDTDVDGTLQKLMENDPGVTEVNLNNIKVILFMLHFVIWTVNFTLYLHCIDSLIVLFR